MARSKVATKAYPKAPDGGYGWIIVFSSFMIHFLADGVTYTFGIFYVELLQHFKAGKGITAWVPSIMTGITYGIGPIASGLTNKYGCRTITIVGALFASFGLMTSAFAPNVTYLFFSIGICAGAGLGLIYLPAIVSVTCYFEKRRAFATGIAVCGSGLGGAAFAPLTEWLIGLYGWRGGLLIISSLLLNCCVFGALLRPLKENESNVEEETMVENSINNNVDSSVNHKSIKIDLNIKTIDETINDDKNKPRNVIISKKISPQNNDFHMGNTVNGDIMITKSCYSDNNNNDQSIVATLPSLTLESNNNNNNSLSNGQAKEIPMLTISEPLSPSRHSICALHPPLADQFQPSMDQKSEPLIVNNNLINGSIIGNGNKNGFGYQIQHNLRLNNNINSNSFVTNNQLISSQPDEQATIDQSNVIQRRKNSASGSCGILYRRDIFYSASTMHLNLPSNTKSNKKLSYSASTSAVNDLSTSSIASESSTSPDVGTTSGQPVVNSNKSNSIQNPQIDDKFRYINSSSLSLSSSSSSSSPSSSTTVTTASSSLSSSSSSLTNVSKFRWYFMSDWLTFLCSDEVRDTLDEMMNFRLLRNPIFLIFSISNLLTSLGFYVPHIYIKDRVVGRKLASDSEASNLLAIMGIASTFGRLIFGFISDLKVINRLLLFNCCISLCGLSTILSSFVQTYTFMALYCAIFGITCGAYVSLTSVILVDLLGIEKLTNAFGLVLLFQGVACLLGPPIVGWMFDLTGSYDPGFSWAGSMILIGGLILFLLPYLTHGRFKLSLHNTNKRKSPKITVDDINLVVN